MAAANASTAAASSSTAVVEASTAPAAAVEEVAAKAVHKRYENLMTVRTKAIKGKGAWYWAHLEPILVPNADTGLPKAVKLRCALCDAVFSASNPSRTASEHLKRGTCPNFSSPSVAASAAGGGGAALASPPRPISAIAPCSSAPLHHHSHHPHHHPHHHHQPNSRKRSASAAAASAPSPAAFHVSTLALVDPSRFSSSPTAGGGAGDVVFSGTPPAALPQTQLVLSGGKEDLGALAMLEDSVKKLKSPKASPGPALSKAQAHSAIALLADWLYESAGTAAVSLSSVEHPKFRAFLHQVGLPPLSRRDLAGPRLDARFDEARADADARVRDALFFQLAADGWKPRAASADPSSSSSSASSSGDDAVVSLTVNLPNGSTVFHRALFTQAGAPSKYAEEVLWDTLVDVCGGGGPQRCAGIVADRFMSTALRNLETQHHWMVNLSCQLQAFRSLVKDFARDLPLFRATAANCAKLAAYFNSHPAVRSVFFKHQLEELEHEALLRAPPYPAESWAAAAAGSHAADSPGPVLAMLEDVLASARPLQLAVLDESYKLVCLEDPVARELSEMIRDMGFWSDLDALHSLVKLVQDMAQEVEAERPLIGQCLPLWDELRSKVKEWCAKFSVDEEPVRKVIDKRFKKNYHPAWSAAFILDPLYLTKDASGKYLPPFKCLTPEQEKDVDRLITRLVTREEAHIALMELMKWRAEGLDPLYAQAVQVKQLDPATGKMRIANPQSSRLVWETCLKELKSLGKVAVRLIFLHATACGFRCNPSLLRHGRSRAGVERAQKLLFVAANAKLERRDFSNEDDKDAELFDDGGGGEDDVLNEPPPAFVDHHHHHHHHAPSV